MNVSDLNVKQINYWLARMDGMPAEELELMDERCVRRTGDGRYLLMDFLSEPQRLERLAKEYNALPIQKDTRVKSGAHAVYVGPQTNQSRGEGPTYEIAIGRALIRYMWGDQVDEWGCRH